VGVLVLAPNWALAQEAWPAKPIRIIVPFPAGGAVDPLVRGLSSGLGARLGRPVLAEPEWREKVMPRNAYDAVGAGPDELERFLASNRAAGKKIAEMLKAAGYRPE